MSVSQGEAHSEGESMVVAMGEAPCCNIGADSQSFWRVHLWHTVYLRTATGTCGLPLEALWSLLPGQGRGASLDLKHPVLRLWHSLLVKGSSAGKWREQRCECKMLYKMLETKQSLRTVASPWLGRKQYQKPLLHLFYLHPEEPL